MTKFNRSESKTLKMSPLGADFVELLDDAFQFRHTVSHHSRSSQRTLLKPKFFTV
jgi:hypothetical protein